MTRESYLTLTVINIIIKQCLNVKFIFIFLPIKSKVVFTDILERKRSLIKERTELNINLQALPFRYQIFLLEAFFGIQLLFSIL